MLKILIFVSLLFALPLKILEIYPKQQYPIILFNQYIMKML